MAEKLTPEEIKKALECCKPDNDEGCLNCPLANVPLPECAEILSKESVDLINRQQAEMERLKKENNQFADIGKMYSEIRAEAIKEFAERLEEKIFNCDLVYVYEHIDNLVKEMVGDDK